MSDELTGQRVLVVEDEFFLAEEIAEALTRAGAQVIGPVADLAGALDQTRDGGFDLVVLDINLNGEMAYPLADTLIVLGVPFLFTTSYGAAEIPMEFRDRPRVEKPYNARTLVCGVAGLIGPASC